MKEMIVKKILTMPIDSATKFTSFLSENQNEVIWCQIANECQEYNEFMRWCKTFAIIYPKLNNLQSCITAGFELSDQIINDQERKYYISDLQYRLNRVIILRQLIENSLGRNSKKLSIEEQTNKIYNYFYKQDSSKSWSKWCRKHYISEPIIKKTFENQSR